MPVTLSADDEGVFRIDLTHEYVRAAMEQKLGYRDLKELARNGLEYSFVPGQQPVAGRQLREDQLRVCGDVPVSKQPGRAVRRVPGEGQRKGLELQWQFEGEIADYENRVLASPLAKRN